MRYLVKQKSSCCLPQRWRINVLLPFLNLIIFLMRMPHCNSATRTYDEQYFIPSSSATHLRGRINIYPKDELDLTLRIGDSLNQNKFVTAGEQQRNLGVVPTAFLTPSSTFQIIMSILLGILIILQLFVFGRFLRNRSKRVLEFTQPDAICIFVACSITATASCYLYVFVSSSLTCAIREPLLFTSVSLMGATVAGRAWRISTLVNNPLLTAGKNSRSSDVSKMERIRLQMLRVLSVLSAVGCSISSIHKRRGTTMSVRREDRKRRRSSTIRTRVTLAQMMRATFFMILPQLFWQVVVLSTTTLRSSRELVSNAYLNNGNQMMTMEQYQCRSTVGLWPHCISMFLALCPYAIAYILNIRPKQELDLLPEMIDEKEKLEQSFYIFARVITVSAPVIGLTYANSPDAKIYSTICAVLAFPLACCYNIAYLKFNAIKSSTPSQRSHGTSIAHLTRSSRGKGTMGRRSTTSVLRMTEMYSRIDRNEEAVQLVDETLELYRKSNAGDCLNDGIRKEGKQEVSLGFTKNDLKALEEEDLVLIIQLLKLKMNALERLEGMPGLSKRAKMNIGALKLFENCPAAREMKDISFMFPIYNLAGEQIKTGVIDVDDEISLEMELATHCHREAQIQSYHYARSLANLAELYGRVGMPDEAFKCFNIMEAVYMKQDHPKLLTDAYAIDRCAVCYVSSALWYLQKGENNNAIERCNYVIDHIIPQYDKNDILGLYMVFVPLIRVLKWNGEAGKALEAYCKFMPDAANIHWAVGSLHKPTTLLLQICEGSSHQYNDEFLSEDIETALSFDVMDQQDNYFTNYGWSMNTLAAELCMLLAQRLKADDTSREKLIDRGITRARIAQHRTTTLNGKVKHILAHECNEIVLNELCQLSNKEVNNIYHLYADKSIMYDHRLCLGTSKCLSMPPSEAPKSLHLNGESTTTASFSNRLKTIMSTKKVTESDMSSVPSSSKLPSHVTVRSKRIELSSMESIGSTKRSLPYS